MHDASIAPVLPPPLPPEYPQPIAHWSHTLALVCILLFIAFYGHSRTSATAVETVSHATRYSGSVLMEWLLLGSVIAGIYNRRQFLLTAFNNRSRSAGASVALGVAVYVAGNMAILATALLLYRTPLFHQRNEAVITAMLPHTPLEFLMWFGVSLTAGITEELIFRGYLLQQLTAWTQKPVASIFIAALLFGCVHLYEGLGAILPLAALAVVYGFVVRHFRGDLRMVIVAHTLQDFLVAVMMLARPLAEHYRNNS